MYNEEYDSIKPYNDDEAMEALGRVSNNLMLPVVSKYLFPDQPYDTLKNLIRSVHSIEEFQNVVMTRVLGAILNRTSSGFTYSGIENIMGIDGKFLAVSNHRDIILDPALTQYVLYHGGLPMTEICVGNNLLSSQLVEDLMRSNRMIKVIRGISARELYLSSQILSSYIRSEITGRKSSVWIAQKEGRAKNGLDTTEQGLLKMFDMSGEKDFTSNFKELNIVPLSISYEYEPCDARKAREILLRQQNDGKYEKKKDEDLHSILTGIRQQKGHIHLSIGKPLTEAEIELASECKGNDRYQAIRGLLDRRIRGAYHLYKTNYIGYDLMTGGDKYASKYTPEDLEAFKKYTAHKLGKIEKRLQGDALEKIFFEIYGNPVLAKEG